MRMIEEGIAAQKVSQAAFMCESFVVIVAGEEE